MKNFFFYFKKMFLALFEYPTATIDEKDIDYNAYWDSKRGDTLGRLSHWQKQRANLVLKIIPSSEQASIGDVGCGDGSVLNYLSQHMNVSELIGVDVSDSALAKAKDFNINTIQADINDQQDWKVIPRTDYILLFEILEHVQDSEKLLNDMLAKSEKGVFFSIPNTGFYTHRFRLLLGKFPLQWRVHPREHIRFWTYSDLKWWLKALGYTKYTLQAYEGVPVLNRVWPSLFGAGIFVFLPHQ